MNRFVIITEVRTGYQMIAMALNSHPDVICLGEIFGSDRDIRKQSLFRNKVDVYEEDDCPVEYLESVTSSLDCGSFGFKLNYDDHVRLPNLCHLKSYLRDTGWKIIHLTRENMLDRLMSQKLAWQEEVWRDKEYSSRVHIEPLEFINNCIHSWQWRDETEMFFRDSNLLRVFYEKTSSCPEHGMDRIQRFIGCEPMKLSIITRKQMRKSQFYHIQNFRELYHHFEKEEHLRRSFIRFFQQIPLL